MTKDGPAAEGDGADPAADGRSAEAKRKSGEKVLREVKTTQEQLTRLDEWIRATRQPFGWKVGERIAASLATSELRLIEAASVLMVQACPLAKAVQSSARSISAREATRRWACERSWCDVETLGATTTHRPARRAASEPV